MFWAFQSVHSIFLFVSFPNIKHDNANMKRCLQTTTLHLNLSINSILGTSPSIIFTIVVNGTWAPIVSFLSLWPCPVGDNKNIQRSIRVWLCAITQTSCVAMTTKVFKCTVFCVVHWSLPNCSKCVLGTQRRHLTSSFSDFVGDTVWHIEPFVASYLLPVQPLWSA